VCGGTVLTRIQVMLVVIDDVDPVRIGGRGETMVRPIIVMHV